MKIIETKSISKLIGKYVCITIDKYNIDQIEHKLKINEFLEDEEWNKTQKKNLIIHTLYYFQIQQLKGLK